MCLGDRRLDTRTRLDIRDLVYPALSAIQGPPIGIGDSFSILLPGSPIDSFKLQPILPHCLVRPLQLETKRLSPAMSYFFSTPVDIDIVLEDSDNRPTVNVKLDKDRIEKAPLYADGESVKGAVTIRPKDGKRLEHTGIKVQFIGTIGTLRLPSITLRPRR